MLQPAVVGISEIVTGIAGEGRGALPETNRLRF